jgi:hypothetical protein
MRYKASRGRRAALLTLLAALLFGVVATTVSCTGSAPVSKSAPKLVTSASTYYPLLGNRDVFPTNTNPPQEAAVVLAVFSMKGGDVRRVTGQLDIRMPSAHGQEIDAHLFCYDQNFQQIGEVSTGTNYYTNGGRAFQWDLSMLIAAPAQSPEPGAPSSEENYLCTLDTYVFDSDTSYAMTVLAPTPGETKYGTWLEISPPDNDAEMWTFDQPYCSQPDDSDTCPYIGGEQANQNPGGIELPVTGPGVWTAADNATTVDGEATLEITSCIARITNCAADERGDKSDAKGYAWLELKQVIPVVEGKKLRYSPCQDNLAYDMGNWDGLTPSETYDIPANMHHDVLFFHVSAPVSPCDGSRLFLVDLYIAWTTGNAVQIGDGNINVMNSQYTTTCPPSCVIKQRKIG